MTTTTQRIQFNQLPQYNNAIGANGTFVQAWYRFFAGLLNGTPPQDVSTLAVTASPFSYQAPLGGFIAVHGGTVVSIMLTRDGINVHGTGTTQGCVPMSKGDTAIITYSAPPTINFFPQ